jgi:hypothetical protein
MSSVFATLIIPYMCTYVYYFSFGSLDLRNLSIPLVIPCCRSYPQLVQCWYGSSSNILRTRWIIRWASSVQPQGRSPLHVACRLWSGLRSLFTTRRRSKKGTARGRGRNGGQGEPDRHYGRRSCACQDLETILFWMKMNIHTRDVTLISACHIVSTFQPKQRGTFLSWGSLKYRSLSSSTVININQQGNYSLEQSLVVSPRFQSAGEQTQLPIIDH